MTFRQELNDLMNKYHMEQYSDTPDYILAEFIENMLMALDITINNREKSYGRRKTNECDLHVDRW